MYFLCRIGKDRNYFIAALLSYVYMFEIHMGNCLSPKSQCMFAFDQRFTISVVRVSSLNGVVSTRHCTCKISIPCYQLV